VGGRGDEAPLPLVSFVEAAERIVEILARELNSELNSELKAAQA